MNIRRTMAVTLALMLGLAGNVYAGGGKRLILNLVGTGYQYSGALIDHPAVPDDALCFDLALINAKNRRVMGTATDCLSGINGETTSGNIMLTGTTIFRLPQGTLITQGLTTVAPVEQPTTTPDGQVMTHITGASSTENAIVYGTKRFAESTGTARLSGMVDLTDFSAMDGDPMTFDCLFVIDLD